MKHLHRFLPLLLLAVIFLLPSCRTPKDLVFKEVRNIKLETVQFSSTTLTADVEYYNPNNFSLELRRTDVDVFINDQLLGHTTQEIQLKIPRRNSFVVPVSLAVDMKNLLKNGIIALFNKEVTIRVLGKVKLGKAGVFKSFPVDYQTIQKLSL